MWGPVSACCRAAGPPPEAATPPPEAAAPPPEIVEPPPDTGAPPETAGPPPSVRPEPPAEAVAANGGGQPALSDPAALDAYTVVLGADERMKIPGLPGELRVWIGHSGARPEMPIGMVEDETSVPAVGEAAEIEPFAPAFKIEPAKTQCIKIHPSGSEVRFRLTPQRAGTFQVGANVYLFESADCSGAPVPRTAATLMVAVEVDRKETVRRGAGEFWAVFWAKLLEFWGALLALVFALILFLIRGKLKRWFGFEQK